MEHQYQYFNSKHDQSEEQSHDLQSQFSIISLIKKTILSLKLASLCSLIFVSTSVLFFILYTFKSSFSSVSISSIFSFFAFDRSYMFLLCNGILVFLVKSSSTFTSFTNSSAATTTPENYSDIDHQNEKHVDEKITTSSSYIQQEPAARLMVSERKEITTSICLQQGEFKKEDGYLSAHDDQDEILVAEFPADEQSIVHEIDIDSQYHSSTEFVEVEDDEEEVEDELHRAELNKRCEEFIRKMKEGIKAEAKQQINNTPAFPFLR